MPSSRTTTDKPFTFVPIGVETSLDGIPKRTSDAQEAMMETLVAIG